MLEHLSVFRSRAMTDGLTEREEREGGEVRSRETDHFKATFLPSFLPLFVTKRRIVRGRRGGALSLDICTSFFKS